MEEKQVE